MMMIQAQAWVHSHTHGPKRDRESPKRSREACRSWKKEKKRAPSATSTFLSSYWLTPPQSFLKTSQSLLHTCRLLLIHFDFVYSLWFDLYLIFFFKSFKIQQNSSLQKYMVKLSTCVGPLHNSTSQKKKKTKTLSFSYFFVSLRLTRRLLRSD